MKEPPQFYLIRHGQTAWSITGQHTGTTNIALTQQGEDEARALAARMRTVKFTRVLTSPLLRARQTCELAGYMGVAKLDPDLVEWDYGDYEGRRTADIQEERPGWNVWRDGCPHGETPANISDRADRLLECLRELSGNVALFSHGQFGAALAARWIGLTVSDAQHFALSPASISILAHEAAHPKIAVIALWNSREDQWLHRPAEALPAAGVRSDGALRQALLHTRSRQDRQSAGPDRAQARALCALMMDGGVSEAVRLEADLYAVRLCTATPPRLPS